MGSDDVVTGAVPLAFFACPACGREFAQNPTGRSSNAGAVHSASSSTR